MAVGWHTIAGDGDPISGNPGDFLVVERCFGQIKDRMSELDREYAGIRFGTSDDFRGEAANAFASKIGQISQALGEVPLIAAQLEGTFRSHRTQLEALRSEASSALARAQTNWGAVGSARENCDDATGRLRFVDDQLEYLDSLGEAGDPGDRNYWVSERIEASDWVVSAKSRLSNAEDDLQDSRAEHRQLSDQEDDLDQATAEALRNTVLWSLADPSFLEQLGDAFVDLVDAFGDFADYIFSAEFLLDLYDFLGDLLKVLSVLELVATLLALIPVLTPIFGPIAAGLKTINAVLTGLKLLIGFALAANGTISWTEFGLEVGVMLATLAVGKLAEKAAKSGAIMIQNNSVALAQRFGPGAERVFTIAARITHVDTKIPREAVSGLAEGAIEVVAGHVIPKSDRPSTTENLGTAASNTFSTIKKVTGNFEFNIPSPPFQYMLPVTPLSKMVVAPVRCGP